MKRTAEVSLFWGTHCIAHRSVGAREALVVGDRHPFRVPGLPAEHALVSWREGSPCVHAPRGQAVALGAHESAELPVGAFTFVIQAGEAEALPPVPLGKRAEESALPAVLGSALAHAAFFAALGFLVPTLGSTETEAIGRDQLDAMAGYLTSAAERETEPVLQDTPPVLEEGDDSPQHTGRRPRDTPGALANPVSTEAHDRRTVAGHDRVSDGKLARERELAEAQEFGMVSLLTAAENGDDVGPIAPWGATLAGADKESHLGNLWGADLGDAFGSGLDLSGTGEGNGGRGRGVQLGGLGRGGTGWGGTCDDTCQGGGLGHGWGTGSAGGTGRPRAHAPTVPRLRPDPTISGDGRLDPRIIQRIVRQNEGRFLGCYQDALRGNPALQGRVAVLFVIGRDGGVSLARDSAGSDLPDAGVRQCVVRRFYELGFPEPTGGTVHVVYPLVFTPAE